MSHTDAMGMCVAMIVIVLAFILGALEYTEGDSDL